MQLPPDITLETTNDGSPTLAIRRADGRVEKMHHAGGAISETRFIYGQALEVARADRRPVRALSIGLGLGYNELLTLAAPGSDDTTIFSFEALALLRTEFRAWAGGDDSGVLAATQTRVAELCGPDVRRAAGRALAEGRLRLLGAFPEAARGVTQVNLVYFDVFSNQMDPHLWDEDMLVETCAPLLAEDCVWASYAATGTLNRALARLGFTRLKKAGFKRKPQSTLAVRGTYVP